MSNDGKKSDEDGGDLERTEEKSAAELEAIVRAAERAKIEDEVTHTGDPDEIERAALASATADDDPPPSSEGAPVSLQDLEPEPLSFEPVSLHDVELAMAPGKAPPKIPAAPPARVPPVPRGAAKNTAEDAAKNTVAQGGGAPRPKIVPRAPLKSRASQPDPSELGGDVPIRKRVSSIPPPLPKPGSDDDIMRLSGGLQGGLAAPLVPSDLAPPHEPDAPAKTGEAADASGSVDAEPRARPAPPKKKKPASPAADASDRAPSSSRPPKSKRPEARAAADAPEASPKSKRPPKSERPAAARTSKPPANAQTSAPEEAPKSRTTTYVIVAAAIAVVGYLAFGRGSDPSVPAAPSEVAARPIEAPEPDVGDAPDAPTSEPTPEPSAAPAASDAPVAEATTAPATPTAASPAPPKSTADSAPPAATRDTSPPSAATTTTAKPAASAAPAVAAGPFDKSAASAAMSGAMGAASACKKDGDPSGVARVSVTFAPSGRVTQANIGGPPFAGTATGGCIARAFKTAKVPPFEGDPVTVSKTVNIP